MYRILVVDEQPLILLGYQTLLANYEDCFICGEASDHETAVKMVASRAPNLVLADVFGDSIGFQLIDQLRRRKMGPRILVVSAMNAEFVAHRCLMLGAHGFIGKWEPTSKVFNAIHTVRNERLYFHADIVAASFNDQVSCLKNGIRRPVGALTNTEFEILCRVGTGSTSAQIARDLNLAVKTIEKYRSNIRNKLKLKSLSEFTHAAAALVRTADRQTHQCLRQRPKEG